MQHKAHSVKQSIADKAHRVKESVHGEFDKMQPRNSEEQAWTQGRVVANTPEVQQRPSYQGSSRRIVTEPLDQPEFQGKIPSNTSATYRSSEATGQGRNVTGQDEAGQGKSSGQLWEQGKADAAQKASDLKETASEALHQAKDSVKTASGNKPSAVDVTKDAEEQGWSLITGIADAWKSFTDQVSEVFEPAKPIEASRPSQDASSTSSAGRTAHEAADVVKQEGRQAKSTVKQVGEVLEDGFVAAVQAPRHLAETVKRQIEQSDAKASTSRQKDSPSRRSIRREGATRKSATPSIAESPVPSLPSNTEEILRGRGRFAQRRTPVSRQYVPQYEPVLSSLPSNTEYMLKMQGISPNSSGVGSRSDADLARFCSNLYLSQQQ